ncbi:RUMI [Lepeophtheirus salmonis]|uniref:RUMI n=1 Tax=Lepeophtheirus salmonis TaxID=72036 RepID=A0A7R8CRN7_LEPSM|nr:RUMI [Lepeophtheirus salmonis]CAF2907312.1 RUMI [Lepeophtheirus salmonis]
MLCNMIDRKNRKLKYDDGNGSEAHPNWRREEMTSLLLHGICSIKVLGGAGCEVGASESDTIEQIKEIVAQRLQVAVDHQTLLFEGRTLKDANLVKDYKLKEGSKINLIVKSSRKEETGHLNSHHKDIYSALRKYFQTEEEARRVSKAFEQALLRKLSYLSLDDMERLSDGSSCRWEFYIDAFKSAHIGFSEEPCLNDCCFTQLIHDDLSHFHSIKKSDLDLARETAAHPVTYIISDGELYRSPECLFPSRCKGIEHFLHRIKKSTTANVEFVVGVHDWPHVNKYTLKSKDPIPPVFSFSKNIRLLGYYLPRMDLQRRGPRHITVSKGTGGSRTSSERDNLILLSRKHPELVDAQYTKNQGWKSEKDTLGAPPAKEVALENHCKYKYLFNFRGVAASFRFKHLFLCESLVFHVGDEWTEFFYSELKPWVHYVPVSSKASIEEIKELIDFFNDNKEIAEIIAESGHDFYQT